MATAVLFIVLALQYQSMWGFFAFLLVLDIVSHWFQMYSKLSQKIESHKGSRNFLLNFYYCEVMTFWPRLPWLLFFCVGNEMFLVCLYVLSFPAEVMPLMHSLCTTLAFVSFPVFAAKNLFNIIQLIDASGEVADADYAEHIKQNRGAQ